MQANKLRHIILSLLLFITSTTLVLTTTSVANADYDQTGWHATSVWNEGTTSSTTVIDCASMIIANTGSGQVPVPGTGIVAGMGTEVNLNTANPKVGDSFYIHIWGRSVGTPCGGEGFIPIFNLPSGVTLDTSKKVVCASDGVVMGVNDPTCPQPGAAGAKFQSAQAETGNPNSYKILCGYTSGCLGYAWPAAYGHGFEFGIPVKSTQTYNAGSVGGGAWIVDPYRNSLMPLSAPLNVFGGTAGNGTPPGTVTPVGGGTPIPDPGTAYRVVYENPSTYASPKFPMNTSMSTVHGVISTGTVYTNHVPGVMVIARDSDPNKLNSLSSQLGTLDSQMDAGTIPVNQFTYGNANSSGAAYRVDYDWGDTNLGNTVWGTNVAVWNPGTKYYWKLGFAPLPNGNSDISTAKVTWGSLQSFTAQSASDLVCDGKAVTVSIAQGQLPTDGNDVIMGTPGDDSINGGLGNDTICGGGGNDILLGGPGNDTIYGGVGDDIILPGTGMDGAYGQDGSDTVSYADLSTPGANNSGVTYNPTSCSSGFNTVCGAGGLDYLSGPGKGPVPEIFVGSPFNDNITLGDTGNGYGITTTGIGGDGDDILTGSPLNDVIIGGSGVDTINAMGGNDNIDSRDTVNEAVNCGAGTDKIAPDQTDTLTDCETVVYPPPPASPAPPDPPLAAMPGSWVKKWPGRKGVAKVGKKLKVGKVTFSKSGKPQHLSVSFQWLVGGNPAGGRAKYAVPASARGSAISVVIRVNKPGYAPLTRTLWFGVPK